MKVIVKLTILAAALLLVANMAFAVCPNLICYAITATHENGNMYDDYWEVCLQDTGNGSLYSENASYTYDLYLFSGGPSGYRTEEGLGGWTTWIALGSGPESTGYIWTPVDGAYLKAIGQNVGTRYSVQGMKVPCEPDL